jgi:hypothetical protein
MKFLTFVATALSAIRLVSSFAAIAPGATVPSIELHRGFPPEMINISEYVKGRNVAIVGLPAAFTAVRGFEYLWSNVFSVLLPYSRFLFVSDLIREKRSRIPGICR